MTMRIRRTAGYWLALLPALCAGCATSTGGGAAGARGTVEGGEDECGGVVPADVTFGAVWLSPEELARMPLAINPFAANPDVTLPDSVDLTDHMPPAGDQGRLASCTAWAVAYAGATYTAGRQYGWDVTHPANQASPGFLYGKSLEADGTVCGSGTRISSALNLLIEQGCSSMQTAGYSRTDCLESLPVADAANFRIGSFNRVVHTNRDALKAELAAGRIVVFGATLYDDFPSYNACDEVYVGSGRYMLSGSNHATHTMALVGYDDALEAWRIMNSWSQRWGHNGFGWMAYETFGETAFAAFSIEPADVRRPPGSSDGLPPGTDLTGRLLEAYQFADATAGDPPPVYLVFLWSFDAPVFVRSVMLIGPSGLSGAPQVYDQWFVHGVFHFVQADGFQWEPGEYALRLDAHLADGQDRVFQASAMIHPLNGAATEGLCLNYCAFAYDGQCDDGGPESESAVCDYGSDCADCGPRPPREIQSASVHNPEVGRFVFRGIPVSTRSPAADLPSAGIQPGIRGANGQPLAVP